MVYMFCTRPSHISSITFQSDINLNVVREQIWKWLKATNQKYLNLWSYGSLQNLQGIYVTDIQVCVVWCVMHCFKNIALKLEVNGLICSYQINEKERCSYWHLSNEHVCQMIYIHMLHGVTFWQFKFGCERWTESRRRFSFPSITSSFSWNMRMWADLCLFIRCIRVPFTFMSQILEIWVRFEANYGKDGKFIHLQPSFFFSLV